MYLQKDSLQEIHVHVPIQVHVHLSHFCEDLAQHIFQTTLATEGHLPAVGAPSSKPAPNSAISPASNGPSFQAAQVNFPFILKASPGTSNFGRASCGGWTTGGHLDNQLN